MTPIKNVLTQIQLNEKKYSPMIPDTTMSEYVQYLQKKNTEAIDALAENNLNLNLCKTYLSKLISSHLTSVEVKRDIKEFLESIR